MLLAASSNLHCNLFLNNTTCTKPGKNFFNSDRLMATELYYSVAIKSHTHRILVGMTIIMLTNVHMLVV